MTKISKKEYEILKGLDDQWKWIARDERDDVLFAHTLKPIKQENGWANIDFGYKFLRTIYFQFIKWDDEEPYNIAGLIEEYEYSADHVSHVLNERVKALGNAWKESKETELKSKKDLIEKWESAIESAEFYGKGKEEDLIGYMKEFIADLNQLDEPEVLSLEWIDENEEQEEMYGLYGVPVHKLQSLLVPKQEKEQKYNVRFKVKSSFGTVGIFLYKEGDEVLAGDNFRAYYPKEDEYRLTEQEIRDFQNGDILFEHFAVKVEEMEK